MTLAPQTLFESALNLMSAVDERTTFTTGRTSALVDLARAIADKLDVQAHDLQRLEWACLYCDLGMLALPEALVLKPATLSVSETQQLRSHVNLSLQMLANNPPPVPIADLVAAHHERYDGTGYPRGLRGEEVPFLANILSVADTLIALASDRPHRRGFDAGMIWQTVSAERGRQFFPEIIDALEQLNLSAYLQRRRPGLPQARTLHIDAA